MPDPGSAPLDGIPNDCAGMRVNKLLITPFDGKTACPGIGGASKLATINASAQPAIQDGGSVGFEEGLLSSRRRIEHRHLLSATYIIKTDLRIDRQQQLSVGAASQAIGHNLGQCVERSAGKLPENRVWRQLKHCQLMVRRGGGEPPTIARKTHNSVASDTGNQVLACARIPQPQH